MKLAVNNLSISNNRNISFKGHNADTSSINRIEHKFYLPYDDNKYNAKLELCGFKDNNQKWEKIKNAKPIILDMSPKGIKIPESMLYTADGTATGYRFILEDKQDSSKKIYKIDSGLLSNPRASAPEDTYSLLLPNRSVLTTNGLTKQVMPDICLPGYKFNANRNIEYDPTARARALNAVRTHGNKLGGNFAGIVKMLPIWEEEGYTKIVGTPFTKDEVSSHLYWTENPYQIASSMGTIEDYKDMQKELFKHGINFIADAALVNQGLQGVMFKHVLKHGTNSPFFHWFKAPGLLSSSLELGVIPANKEARENFRFRLVNSPYTMVQTKDNIEFKDNKNYNPKRLTYIQLYDKRLVTKEELESNNLLTRYSKTNTKNPYDITSHNDITQLLAFEINPENFKEDAEKVIKNTPKKERSLENSKFIESLLNFRNFSLTTKDKGGFDLWDGNMDIAKLNFYKGNSDQAYIDRFTDKEEQAAIAKELTEATYQVQDFVLKSAKYWTRLTADTQIEYAANTLRIGEHNKFIQTEEDEQRETKATIENYDKAIKTAVAKGKLPKAALKLDKEKIKYVLSGIYNLPKLDIPTYLTKKEIYIQSQIMDQPFEAIEFSPDLTAVLATPYISQRANSEEYFNLPRHEQCINRAVKIDTTKNKYTKLYDDTDGMFNQEFTNFVTDVLDATESKLTSYQHFFNNTQNVTEYGIYALSALMPDIVKFGTVKALAPKAKIKFDEQHGIIDYSEADLQNISLKTLDISGSSDMEAKKVLKKLTSGLSNISDKDKDKLAKTLSTRIKNISKNDYKIAEAIVNETGSGLGWRIDAAKDIANIDAVRTNSDNGKDAFDAVIKFWKLFNKTIKQENPHAFTTAELTDLGDIIKDPNNKYKNYVDAETKFISQSGLNNTANYMFFYSLLRDMFAQDAEKGILKDEFGHIEKLHEKLSKGWDDEAGNTVCEGFLYQYPDDSTSQSYTFVGNHDKPRVLHVLALDMDLFHSDFGPNKNTQKKRAAKVLQLPGVNSIDSYSISGKAIAMGERLTTALEASGALLTTDNYNNASDEDKKNSDILRKAIASLASGNFKGKKFNPDAFGTRDFRHVLKHVFEEAEYRGYTNKAKEKEYKNAALKNILEPAMDKMKTIYKMLVTLPGSPTDFIGDKEGSTGYETKSNNDFQQNRNAVPFEWVNGVLKINELGEDHKKDFVAQYYEQMTKIGALRKDKRLSALNTGNTVVLPMQKGQYQYTDENGKKHEVPVDVAATYRYDDKGSEVICLYSTEGATSNCTEPMKRHTVNLKRINLDSFNWREGIKGGLKEGTIFKNINGTASYVVKKEQNGSYYLERIKDDFYEDISILDTDYNTAVLYKEAQTPYQPVLIYPNMNYSRR